jgi:hypothetical protein
VGGGGGHCDTVLLLFFNKLDPCLPSPPPRLHGPILLPSLNCHGHNPLTTIYHSPLSTAVRHSTSRYPTHLKQVFHVKSLHYGHIAKSFALREAPSDADQSGKPVGKAAQDKANKAELNRKRKTVEQKRRKDSRVHNNEHGSGGSMSGPKPKKRRKNH